MDVLNAYQLRITNKWNYLFYPFFHKKSRNPSHLKQVFLKVTLWTAICSAFNFWCEWRCRPRSKRTLRNHAECGISIVPWGTLTRGHEYLWKEHFTTITPSGEILPLVDDMWSHHNMRIWAAFSNRNEIILAISSLAGVIPLALTASLCNFFFHPL